VFLSLPGSDAGIKVCIAGEEDDDTIRDVLSEAEDGDAQLGDLINLATCCI
jgi:hypothetical protein